MPLVPVRAVAGSRVSDTHGDEGKVSHLVQAESATRHALAKEWEIVGSFEDLDVSAEVTPWKRPDLGPWLTERQGEWDALVWAKVDRAFRSAKDCADVGHLGGGEPRGRGALLRPVGRSFVRCRWCRGGPSRSPDRACASRPGLGHVRPRPLRARWRRGRAAGRG
ncbi:recombinase family protein [Kitasatospora sp. NPDC057541]|uniref:recombinase family protein n=1 Tax=unclassified Kitasatospora TaxID=2633591 RepID=UPI0036AC806E